MGLSTQVLKSSEFYVDKKSRREGALFIDERLIWDVVFTALSNKASILSSFALLLHFDAIS